MADEADVDDQWLYGDAPNLPADEAERQEGEQIDQSTEDKLLAESDHEAEGDETAEQADGKEEQDANEMETQADAVQNSEPTPPADEERERDASEEEKQNGEQSEKEDEEEDDESDDDVNVVIGDIKTSPSYASLNIKRGGLNTTLGDKSKIQQAQTGKFTVDEFDQMGMINGVPAGDYSLDSLEDKPWRKPGADITDYFNYGFNEDTWKAYCERQKRMRVGESGVGIVPLNAIGMPRGPIPIMNDNSKYSGSFMGLRKAGPPPGRRMTGAIDVIGGSGGANKLDAPKENVIQVMTADRREYSRKPPGFPDMSMPPPQPFDEFQPEFGFNPEPEPFYGGYEPTQDVQWGSGNSNWTPNQIKSLTPGPVVLPVPPPNRASGPLPVPPPGNMPIGGHASSNLPPIVPMPLNSGDGATTETSRRDEPRESERENRARSEKRDRDRDRERSHRRERSRSRSRRHKSRSRSPSHRSHRKKKSRRHEESD